jgi:type IV pilus assembly protein PilC
MPSFYYRARDKDGVLITGEIEATAPEEVKESLFREGMVPLDVRRVRTTVPFIESIKNLANRVKDEDIMLFTRQFYTLFKAGVSMDTASLSQAFGRHPRIFNELYVSMLAAGEEAGILEQVLKNLSEVLQKDYTIQKNVKGAVLYPKIVITVLVLAVVFRGGSIRSAVPASLQE